MIEAARGVPTILTVTFVNARTVEDALATGDCGARVTVIGCGWKGYRSSEDESAAGANLHRLRDKGFIGSTSGRSVL